MSGDTVILVVSPDIVGAVDYGIALRAEVVAG